MLILKISGSGACFSWIRMDLQKLRDGQKKIISEIGSLMPKLRSHHALIR
jgi:hypothetical protein